VGGGKEKRGRGEVKGLKGMKGLIVCKIGRDEREK